MATRRVRIVCISDTHNQTPRLPVGDILIHAGDLTNQGSFSELQKTVDWIKQSQFQVKIIVCGNHEVTCDKDFYAQYGQYFHNKKMEDPQHCIDLLSSDPTIVYLHHESKTVVINHADGSSSRLNVFGSPYSPTRGMWAFGYPSEAASGLWDLIPLETDIVVTHTPPKFHRDECPTLGTSGCEILRQTLWRVRPRLAVCGHIHGAYGVEVVEWDLSVSNVKYKEKSTREYNDPQPSSKKQYLVDFSSRPRVPTLRNDGSGGHGVGLAELRKHRGTQVDGHADAMMVDKDGFIAYEEDAATIADRMDQDDAIGHGAGKMALPSVAHPATPPFPGFQKAERPSTSLTAATSIQHLGTRGQGGPASSPRSDQEAISGREGRAETCIVNAAFIATNWPHEGGKRFHKPIVIDLDLPIPGLRLSA